MRRIAAALLFVVCIVPARADHVPDAKLRTTLIIGVVAFNPEQKSGDSKVTIDPMVHAYLESVSTTAARYETDLHFQVVRGNYYQVLRWMRDGSIDGALVSPFTYHVLLGDTGTNRAPLPLALFKTRPLSLADGDLDGNAPMFRAMCDDQPAQDPDGVFAACVDQLNGGKGEPCTFAFVAHLSTTGFLYPLLRIEKELALRGSSVWKVMPALLSRTQFRLWHKEIETKGVQLQFTYASGLLGTAEDQLGQERKVAPQTIPEPERIAFVRNYVTEKKRWRPLLPGRDSFEDDILVLSGVSTRAIALRDKFPDDKTLWRPTDVQQPLQASTYLKPVDFDPKPHKDLAGDISELFKSSEAKDLWERWFLKELYEFTPQELVELLKNDQLLGGREEAAIVLPGGGVRGAYQAVVLDGLYDDKHIVNIDAPPDPEKKSLVVSSVVGTSGGALMGYFAARKPYGKPLTERWVENNKVVLHPSHVFPYTGAMRWFSILAGVVVFTFWTTLLWPKPRTAEHLPRGVPVALTIPIAAVLFGTPYLIRKLAINDIGMSGWAAGIFYVCLVLIIHLVHSVIEPSKTNRSRFWLAAGLASFGVGALCAWCAIRFDALWLAIIGVALIVAGLFMVGRGFGMSISRVLLVEYLNAAALLAAFFVGAGLLFGVPLLFHRATTVELTTEYWLWLGIATTVMSLAIMAVHEMPSVQKALAFWFRVTQSKPFFYTPMVTLMVSGFVALASWVAFVAPALYDGGKGATQFSSQASPMTRLATARFVAALTTLGTPLSGRYKNFKRFDAGDYYAAVRDRTLPTFPRLLVYEPTDNGFNEFLNAVNASGSPFPIYPGRTLAHGNEAGIFIDGGYTHLVPVEGAVKLGAKQVLIVANKPYDERVAAEESNWSLLLSDLPRTAGFLFDRAQVVDHLSQKDVMVATIAPTSEDAAPFLMDFRQGTIAGLVTKAREDVKLRPGRVASWGQPTVFLMPPTHGHPPKKQ